MTCDGFFCDRTATHVGRWWRGDIQATAVYCQEHARLAARDQRVRVTPLGGAERVDGDVVRRYQEVAAR